MIIVGDLHLTDKIPYYNANKTLLKEIFKYDENILFLGDIFDKSSPHWKVYEIFKEYVLTHRKHLYMIQGNHDFSKKKGSAVNNFELLENVSVFSEITETNIEGLQCLIIPFMYSKESYENISFKGDYCFGHFTPEQESFGKEFVDISKINVKKIIIGHIHKRKTYKNLEIVGVPLPTRNLENPCNIFRLENDELLEIELPDIFKIVDIEYGDMPDNKKYLYNILNAPTREDVFEKYRGYYIREDGINLIQLNDIVSNLNESSGLDISLQDYKKDFNGFVKNLEDKTIVYDEAYNNIIERFEKVQQ